MAAHLDVRGCLGLMVDRSVAGASLYAPVDFGVGGNLAVRVGLILNVVVTSDFVVIGADLCVDVFIYKLAVDVVVDSRAITAASHVSSLQFYPPE